MTIDSGTVIILLYLLVSGIVFTRLGADARPVYGGARGAEPFKPAGKDQNERNDHARQES